MRFVRIAAQDFLIFAASEIVMFLDRGMVGRLPLKRMSRRSVGKSADDKRDRPCRFVSLPLQAVRRGGGPCANAAIRFRGDRSGGFRQRHSLFLYRARFRRADRLVNLGYRIRGFRTVCRTDVSCFRQAGLARFASVPNNNFHWKFVLLENKSYLCIVIKIRKDKIPYGP